MRYHIEKTRNYLTAITSVVSLFGAQSVLAQVGTMDYASDLYVPAAVPVGGGVFLLVLGALLGLAAFWKISRSGISGNKVVAIFLTMGAAAFSMSGGQILQQAYAKSGTPLSNPNGGTVDVYPGYQEYFNTSGAILTISDISLQCQEAKTKTKDGQSVQGSSFPKCIAGSTILQDGDICYTSYADCLR